MLANAVVLKVGLGPHCVVLKDQGGVLKRFSELITPTSCCHCHPQLNFDMDFVKLQTTVTRALKFYQFPLYVVF